MTKAIHLTHSDLSGIISPHLTSLRVPYAINLSLSLCSDHVVVGSSVLGNQTSPPCQLLKDLLPPHLHHTSAEGVYVKLLHQAKMTAHLKGHGMCPVAMGFTSFGKVLAFCRDRWSVLLKQIITL